MKSVLGSSKQNTEDNVNTVTCYTDAVTERTECHLQNADSCSQSACASDIAGSDTCQGGLTDAEAESFYYCALQ